MKVVIRNGEGKFLSRFRGEISFVDRKSRAFVYDKEKDKVEEQLKTVNNRYGCNWTWEEITKEELLQGLQLKTEEAHSG